MKTRVAQQPTSSGDGWLARVSGDPAQWGQSVAVLLELPCETFRQNCPSCEKYCKVIWSLYLTNCKKIQKNTTVFKLQVENFTKGPGEPSEGVAPQFWVGSIAQEVKCISK